MAFLKDLYGLFMVFHGFVSPFLAVIDQNSFGHVTHVPFKINFPIFDEII